MRENKKSITIFLGVTFLFWVTLYIYVPTLPTFIKMKADNLAMVGLVLSMYGLWMLVARLPMGIAVDSMGRGKPLIMAGLFLCALGAFIMGKGESLGVLAFGRALTGLSAATWVPLLVVFSSFFTEEEAIFSSALLSVTMSFGRILGTSLTGVLNRAGGYPLPFFLATITGVVAIGLVPLVKEERRPVKGVSLRAIVSLFARKDVVLPALISAVVHYVDWSVTFSFLPILAQELGASDVIKSVIISLNIASIAVATLANTMMLKRVKHTLILCGGAGFMFCGIIVLSIAQSLPMLLFGTALMGFAFGVVYPILLGMSIHRVDRIQRNTAMGIHQSIYAIGMWTGPWLSGIAADLLGIRKMFVLTGGIYLVLVYLFILLLVRSSNKETE
ncbi:MAG TPA: MFS transporter [Spirochaetota bacterium]|nr:MFS transporter [Spirochaetota bacterium]